MNVFARISYNERQRERGARKAFSQLQGLASHHFHHHRIQSARRVESLQRCLHNMRYVLKRSPSAASSRCIDEAVHLQRCCRRKSIGVCCPHYTGPTSRMSISLFCSRLKVEGGSALGEECQNNGPCVNPGDMYNSCLRQLPKMSCAGFSGRLLICNNEF